MDAFSTDAFVKVKHRAADIMGNGASTHEVFNALGISEDLLESFMKDPEFSQRVEAIVQNNQIQSNRLLAHYQVRAIKELWQLYEETDNEELKFRILNKLITTTTGKHNPSTLANKPASVGLTDESVEKIRKKVFKFY